MGLAIAAAGATAIAASIGILGLSAVVGAAATVVAGLSTAFGVAAAVIAAILSPIGMVVAAVVGLVAYFVWASSAITKSLDWLRKGFDVLKKDALAAFGGISDAMKAGDMQLAVKILWAFLKLEWMRGINWLKDIWDGFKGFWADGVSGLAMLFVDAVAGVKTAWVEMIAFLKKQWEDFKRSGAISAMSEWLAKRELMSKEGLSSEEADEAIAKARRAVQRKSDRKKQAIDFDTAAKKELADLNKKAAEKKKQGKLGDDPEKPGAKPPPGTPRLPTAAALGGIAVGTFSAAQSTLMGGGSSIAERAYRTALQQAKSLKQIKELNRKMHNELKKSRLVATA